MSETNGHGDVIGEPPTRIDGAPWPSRVPDLVRRAVDGALARSTDDRAWALVRLAADLRALDDPAKALRVLDLAWHLAPSSEPSAAMYTCAIACHCDKKDFDLAHLIASEQPDECRDVKFARVACRLYATLLAETGEECWNLELERHVVLAGGAAAPPPLVVA